MGDFFSVHKKRGDKIDIDAVDLIFRHHHIHCSSEMAGIGSRQYVNRIAERGLRKEFFFQLQHCFFR